MAGTRYADRVAWMRWVAYLAFAGLAWCAFLVAAPAFMHRAQFDSDAIIEPTILGGMALFGICVMVTMDVVTPGGLTASRSLTKRQAARANRVALAICLRLGGWLVGAIATICLCLATSIALWSSDPRGEPQIVNGQYAVCFKGDCTVPVSQQIFDRAAGKAQQTLGSVAAIVYIAAASLGTALARPRIDAEGDPPNG